MELQGEGVDNMKAYGDKVFQIGTDMRRER